VAPFAAKGEVDVTEWEPATDAEIAMRNALRTDDQESYFRILAGVDLLLPVSADALAGLAPLGWGTWSTGGRTHVLAFTSPSALQACLADYTGSARRVAYAELAETWPNLEWWLAVNPGLAIEGYLPAWFVAQLSRGDLRLPTRGPTRDAASTPSRIQDLHAAATMAATAAAQGYASTTSGGPVSGAPAAGGTGGRQTYGDPVTGRPLAASGSPAGQFPAGASPDGQFAPGQAAGSGQFGGAQPGAGQFGGGQPDPSRAGQQGQQFDPRQGAGQFDPGQGRQFDSSQDSGRPEPSRGGQFPSGRGGGQAEPSRDAGQLPSRDAGQLPSRDAGQFAPARGGIGQAAGQFQSVRDSAARSGARPDAAADAAPVGPGGLPLRTPGAVLPSGLPSRVPATPAGAPGGTGGRFDGFDVSGSANRSSESPVAAGGLGARSGGVPAQGGAAPEVPAAYQPPSLPSRTPAGTMPGQSDMAGPGGFRSGPGDTPGGLRPGSGDSSGPGGFRSGLTAAQSDTTGSPSADFAGSRGGAPSGFPSGPSGFPSNSPVSSPSGLAGANGPGASGPGVGGPGSSGPGVGGPGSSGPGVGGPGANGPGAGGPGSSGPGINGPGASGLGANGPGSSGRGANSAGAGGPAGSSALDALAARSAAPSALDALGTRGGPRPGGATPAGTPTADSKGALPPLQRPDSPLPTRTPLAQTPPVPSHIPAPADSGPKADLPRRQVTSPAEQPPSMAAAAQALAGRTPAATSATSVTSTSAILGTNATTAQPGLAPPVIPGAGGPGRGNRGPIVPTPVARPSAPPASPAPQRQEPDEDDFVPANEVERDLLNAVDEASTDAFLSTLLLATVLVPVGPNSRPGSAPGETGFAFRTEEIDGERFLVVFTSRERLSEHFDEPARTVGVRFVELIRNWPDPAWSFAVNPASPVGAKYPGPQVIALASWATEAGLGGDAAEAPTELSAAPPPVAETSAQLTTMQKTIPAEQIDYYLDRGYDRVAGFVHRCGEVEHLRTPGELFGALGLLYDGSPYQADAKEAFVLRWPAHRPSLYRIPYGGQSEQALRAMDGWVIERPPFRGNGFAPGEGNDVIAEFKVDSVRLPHGAQLWRMDADGNETMIAVFDCDAPVWRRIGEQ
jgi:hypothetical protein